MDSLSIALDERLTLAFNQLNQRVLRYVRSECRNRNDAEDLMQETFLRLHRQLQRGDQINDVTGWVLRVAQNLLIDLARHRKRIAPKVGDMPQDALERMIDPSSSQEEALLKNERDRLLLAALGDLTEVQRECVELRASGLKYREIGEKVNKDMRRVGEILHAAVDQLQRKVNG